MRDSSKSCVDVAELVERIPAALYECDVEGRILFANAAYSSITGYSAEELLEMHVWDLQEPGPNQEALPGYLKWLAENQPDPTPYVARNLTRDGRTLTIEVRWDYMRDANGHVFGFACAMLDSTQQTGFQKAFMDIIAGMATVSGEEFLPVIVEQLSRAIEMPHVLVGRLHGDPDSGRVDTLAVWAHNKCVDNYSYDLPGTPSAQVVGNTSCLYMNDVREKFPEDSLLSQMDVASYIGVPLFDSEGQSLGVVAAMNESALSRREADHARVVLELFAARISAEIERRESASDYQLLFDGMVDGFALHDIILDDDGKPVDYRFLAVNPAFERLTGLKAETVVGHTVREVLPDTEEHWIQTFGRVALSGEPCRFEHYSQALGKYFEVVAFCPMPMRFACSFIDVTKRVQALQRLRDSEERLEEAQRISRMGQWELDIKCNALHWSDSIYGLFEVDRDDFASSYESFLGLVHPDDRVAVDKAYQDSLKNRTLFEMTHRLLMPDGRVKYVNEICRTVYDDDGTPLRSIGTVQEITQLKESEAREQALRERLNRAERLESLGVLAGGVAHDLNNILGPIVALPELVQEDLASLEGDPNVQRDIRQSLDVIQSSADRAAEVVRDLVVLSRRERMKRAPMDVSDILAMVNESGWGDSVRTAHPHVDVETRSADHAIPILGDVGQITRAVTNLLQNAAEAMDEKGHLVVSIREVVLEEQIEGYEFIEAGHYGVIDVSDSGKGIDADDLPRIFEPFFTRKKKGERSGSGLGLSIVHGIVKDHDGFVDVSSVAGEGTTFSLYIPKDMGEKSEGNVQSGTMPTGTERVLIVDDEPSQRFLVTQALSRLGYRLREAASGEEALHVLGDIGSGEPPFDLVILDMIMEGGMDGLETYERMLKIFPAQKVLIASGQATNARSIVAQELGADWLSKPYDMMSLANAVRHRLDRR
ncbi:MAG: PAS domain S-box protein [Kiritimatiellae bacterium]|nr:PAS domain S-box protein [Kiritimatiellia bacterium]